MATSAEAGPGAQRPRPARMGSRRRCRRRMVCLAQAAAAPALPCVASQAAGRRTQNLKLHSTSLPARAAVMQYISSRTFASLASSSRKKLSHFQGTSTSRLAPAGGQRAQRGHGPADRGAFTTPRAPMQTSGLPSCRLHSCAGWPHSAACPPLPAPPAAAGPERPSHKRAGTLSKPLKQAPAGRPAARPHAPLARCSSTLMPPPLKAYLFTLLLISLGVSLQGREAGWSGVLRMRAWWSMGGGCLGGQCAESLGGCQSRPSQAPHLTKMALFWSLALILPLSPCREAGGRAAESENLQLTITTPV